MATDPNAFTIDAMLCDSAVTAESKLYVQGGGWNAISAKAFPFIVSRLAIALTVGVPYTETNRQHDLRMELVNQDGNAMAGDGQPVVENGPPPVVAGAHFTLGRPATLQPGERQMMSFALNFERLQFQAPGAYAFVLSIDGTEINRLDFKVAGPAAMTINS